MKGNRSLIWLSMAVFIVLIGSVSLSFAFPAPRATGFVGFTNGDVPATSYFSAHAAYSNPAGKERPAKGFFYYGEMNDAAHYYIFAVECAAISGNQATFGGEIVETNVSDWEGKQVQIWVLDGGTPGSNGDKIYGEFIEPDCDVMLEGAEDPAWIPVESGNLVVHKTVPANNGQPNRPAPKK
ncbi:MAG TPA: hypothetical protein VN260_09115 [Dissulfurispiraceae bacterium]|nr:hypothetical protein [Dissulfurispiraceae bacterium]